MIPFIRDRILPILLIGGLIAYIYIATTAPSAEERDEDREAWDALHETLDGTERYDGR